MGIDCFPYYINLIFYDSIFCLFFDMLTGRLKFKNKVLSSIYMYLSFHLYTKKAPWKDIEQVYFKVDVIQMIGMRLK